MTSRSGYVAIIGKPNVGKSTLLNCLLDKKISITTSKPQTTRTQILGIKTIDDNQIVFIDTPGIHETEQRAMNRYMNRMATAVLKDADVLLFLVDGIWWNDEDEFILKKLKHTSVPVILVINKVDLVKDKSLLLPFIDKMREKFDFANIIPISARNADNVTGLEDTIAGFLPEGPHLFPQEQSTDKPIKFQVAELVREKIIKATEQELPYSTTVEIEHWDEKDNLIDIGALIWVEREGQKVIIIGKNGDRLKKIGTQARVDIENLLGKKVFLRLWVKIKDRWTDDERALKSLGFE